MKKISNEYWMEMALKEAEKSYLDDEVPVGAVIIMDNQIIGKGHNMSILKNDPTSHAEIEAIRDAYQNQSNYRLTKADIYVTLEPCTMCYGAIIHSRIENIFYGTSDLKSGVCGSCEDFSLKKYLNHKPKITGGVLAENCSKILKEFFKEKRV